MDQYGIFSEDDKYEFTADAKITYGLSILSIILSIISSIYAYVLFFHMKGLYNPDFLMHFIFIYIVSCVYAGVCYFCWKKVLDLKYSYIIEESKSSKTGKTLLIISHIAIIPSLVSILIVALLIAVIFSLVDSSGPSSSSGVSPYRIYSGMKKLK